MACTMGPRCHRFTALLLLTSGLAPAIPSRGAEPSAPSAAAEILDSGIAPRDVQKRAYLDYARECIDLLIEHGTDRYGSVQSPILMNILDVRDRTCPPAPLALDEDYRVTRRGRRGPGGANLYTDQPTLSAMLALSRATGEPRYKAFAHTSIGWYLEHLVDEKGLLWWGWHRHYDAHKDQKTGHDGNWHEIHFQEAIWPVLWQINLDATRREIEAIWEWHVIDKGTGEINRHADGKRGCDFAFTGGEIAWAFSFMHERTGEQQWLDRARLVADYFWKQRDPKSNLIPTRPNAGRDRFDGACFDTSTTGTMCMRLLKAWELTRASFLREQAEAYLLAYAKYGWDDRAKSYWASLRLDGTPVIGPHPADDAYMKYQPRNHVDLWQPYVAGYVRAIHTAQAYAYAYELTRNKDFLEAATRWADLLQRNWPPRGCDASAWYGPYCRTSGQHGTYAEYYGRAISFLLHMHELTDERSYLPFARSIADEAVSRLYYRGLLRGHPAKPYYEAMDGVGYLLIALIQLDQLDRGKIESSHELHNW